MILVVATAAASAAGRDNIVHITKHSSVSLYAILQRNIWNKMSAIRAVGQGWEPEVALGKV